MRQEARGKFVSNVPLLSLQVLTLEEQFWLVGKLRPWNFEAGEVIMAQGDIGDRMYIIELGTCEVWKTEPKEEGMEPVNRKICDIGKGDFFGELAVMYDVPRSATIKSQTPVTLLSLSREDLFSALATEKINHMKVLARAQVFSNVPLLAKLDSQIKVLLASKLRADVWQPFQRILRENEHVSSSTRRLYIVEAGQLVSSLMDSQHEETGRSESKPKIVTRKRSVFMAKEKLVQAGAYFGMFEFLYGCSQLNTLIASTESVTLSISYDEMRELLEEEVPERVDEIFDSMIMNVRMFMIKEAHPLLKTCNDAELKSLLASAKNKRFEKWEPILRKGEKLEQMSILEGGCFLEYDGKAEDLMERTMEEVDVNEHSRPGETFGTKSVVGRADPVAAYTLVAVSPVTILNIPKESIQSLPRFASSQR